MPGAEGTGIGMQSEAQCRSGFHPTRAWRSIVIFGA
jgi:hypothetical protein